MSGEDDDGRTVFSPGTGFPAAGPAPTVPPVTAAPVTAMPTTFTAAAIRADARLEPGSMLNDIFEVRRYITAGGMGEVWEGVNTHTDERVAIKVILPHLAADPNVQAMFRKEARTLTRLSHPALVGYRVLAIEPRLGILYIVTDFIDGTMLDQSYRTVPRDAASLKGLARRLAEGLRAAHDMGLVHRDMSPDNVMLEGGAIDRARIIDFGIAKDLDTHKGTIVGDGFAGKIGYVAPEQLGDFGREVGPWTDVYSLALVVLAVALGKSPEMGATLVDAVDKRRAGVDLSGAPEAIRPVLAAMLEPDPKRRLRDMGAVIGALDGAPIAAPAPAPEVKPAKARAPKAGAAAFDRGKAMLIGGVAAAVLAVPGGSWWLLGSDGKPVAPPIAAVALAGPVAVPADPLAAASAAIAAALPGIACSWLDVRDLRRDGDGVSLSLGGVAGDPVAAQGALQQALGRAVSVHDIKADVLTLPRNLCAPVETYGKARQAGPAMLSVEKQRWEMDKRDDTGLTDQKVARVPLFIDPRVAPDDFTIVGLDQSGVSAFGPGRNAFGRQEILAKYEAQPDGRKTNPKNDVSDAGVKGIALIRGQGPFESALVAPPMPVSPDWRARFLKQAAVKGWKVEMVWIQTQDLTPN